MCENDDDLHFVNNIPNYENFIKKTIIIDDTINIWEYDKKNLINVKKFIIGKSNYLSSNVNHEINQELDFDNIYKNSTNNIEHEDIDYDIYDRYNFISITYNKI